MLSEFKKNPTVSAKDLQKSMEHANISVDESTIRKTLNKDGVHGRTSRKKPLLSKKNIAVRLKFTKVHLDVPHRYLQNILCTDETTVELFGRNTTLCVEKKRHSTPTSKHHLNCKVWWREHHGLELLFCLRAWTACYHRWKNEFPSLSRHFAGECKAICSPFKAQQKLDDATGQRPKTQK
uniref:Transposase Tc1-like domain-containing protein n=1 Tax=Oncorhynchus tshawytscha TaxID=74940 RepID=A0AAZ3QEJ1_ONCTS